MFELFMHFLCTVQLCLCVHYVFDHSYDMFSCMCLRKREKSGHVVMFVFLGCFWM